MNLRRTPQNFPWARPGRPESVFYRPQISVVMPVYNHARYLAGSVRSVLTETRYDVELIVVDDGSTDDPERAIADLRDDHRLKFIRNEKNGGLSRALNCGFAAAGGGFLTWTSADNEYLSSALAKMADFLRANPAVGFVYANVRLIDESGLPCASSPYRIPNQSAADRSILELPVTASSLSALNDNFINSCFLFRRRVFSAVGEFDPEKNGYEDYDFWLRAQLFTELAHIDTAEPLYLYRLHGASMTASLRDARLHEQQRESVYTAARLRAQLEAFHPAVRTCAGVTSPGAVPNREFRHRSHERYLAPGTPFPSPLRLPPLLRRARDGSLGAVSPAPGSESTALLFAPDTAGAGTWTERTAAGLVEACRKITWVLFCRTGTQRAFADRVNLQLRENSNLRIVDVSAESDTGWDPPRREHYDDTPWQERSLLYVLSGVDLVCSLSETLSSEAALNELRVEAALAAYAGIPIAAVVGDGRSLADLTEAQKLAFDMPHFLLRKAPESPVLLEAEILALRGAAEVGALEQWLEIQTEAHAAKQLKARELASEALRS